MLSLRAWGRKVCSRPPRQLGHLGQTQLALLVLISIVLLALLVEGGCLLCTHLAIQRAAHEAARWAVTYQPIQGHHLDGSPCIPGEKCYDETVEAYLARRVALIKATAIASIEGKQMEEERASASLLKNRSMGAIDVEVWGYPSFSEEIVPDHPGVEGLPVLVRVSKEVGWAIPGMSVLIPEPRMSAVATMVNEGVQVGYGNALPPMLLTDPREREPNQASLVGSDDMHLIIKEGQLDAQVEDIDTAVEQVVQIAEELEGYIADRRVWGQEDEKLATITIAVPEQEFERGLRLLRAIVAQVLSEEVSGRDVTRQYVDLEGRLHNQEATRNRVLGILDQAETVEEALQVSRELSTIEERIEELQGELDYLHSQVAYSAITLNLTPVSSASGDWRPMEVVNRAGESLVVIGQNVANVLIWIVIVGAPLFLTVYALVWIGGLIVRLTRQRRTPPTSKEDEDV